MQIFNLDFNKNNIGSFYKFFIKDNDTTIKVYIYEDNDVLLNDDNFIGKEKPIELFELAFNEKFIEYVSKGDPDLFKFNNNKYKKIFRKFQELIKDMKK